MRLLRLRVEQLRRFREPVEIRDLEPGINLFAGPNESGKSTLVRAIRAALFERFKSSGAGDLQPWGDTSAAPSVELEFEWQGVHWKLSKRFLRQKRCDLEIGTRRFNGDEAEEKLAELLGYQFPGKGPSKAQHWGVPGLLWIEQGEGQALSDSVAHAGPYLKSALGESLGDLASSAGDALIARVEAERAKLLTASTGRPTGEYAEILRQHEDAVARLTTLDRDIAAYRQQVDRLAELRRLRVEDEGRPWETYRRQAAEAQTKLTEVQGWRQARAHEAQDLEHCVASQQHGRDQQAAYARQHQELEQRVRERDATGLRITELQADRPRIDAQVEQAQAVYRTAEARLTTARRQARRAVLAADLRRLTAEQAHLAADLEQARTLQAHVQALRARLQPIRLDETVLKQLRSMDRTLAELDATRQSAATRLAYDLLPQQHIQVGDEALSGRGERLLLEPVALDVPGIGRLHIQPGGEDLAELARRRQETRDRFDALLSGLGAADLRQAEDQAEQARTLRQEIDLHESRLSGLAPQGVDAAFQAARGGVGCGAGAQALAQVADQGRDVVQRFRIGVDQGHAQGGQAPRQGPRAVGRQPADHQGRTQGQDGFLAELDAVADARDGARLGRVVAAQDGADDVGAGSGGVDQFGGAGRQGDDAGRGAVPGGTGGGGRRLDRGAGLGPGDARAGEKRPGGAQGQAGGGRQSQDAPPHSAEAAHRPPLHRYIRQDRFTNTLEPGVL